MQMDAGLLLLMWIVVALCVWHLCIEGNVALENALLSLS